MKNSEQQSDAAQRFDPLPASSMPNDFSISLDDYRKGGTEMFLEGRNRIGMMVKVIHNKIKFCEIGELY